MALLNLLSIARSALATHQQAMDVTGHNIANAGNDKYTRQRAVVQAIRPQLTNYGAVGRGVTVDSLQRMRDTFLDYRYRDEQSLGSRYQSTNEMLSQIEGVLGEPSTGGLATQLDAFWAAWSDLATDPSGGAARTMVRHSGRELARTLNALDSRIRTAGQHVQLEIDAGVTEINHLANEIAELNTKVVEAEANGGSAGDLRDRRDAAIDRIGEFFPVRVIEEKGGSVRVMISEMLLVDRGVAQQVAVRLDHRGQMGFGNAAASNHFVPTAGRMAGAVEVLNQHIPHVTAQLDQLAAALVDQVNTLHQSGTGANGSTGINFFDTGNLTAGSIRLSADVENSIDAIAAGVSGAAGDGGLALQIAGFRSTRVAGLTGLSMSEFHAELVTELGAEVQNARRVADAQRVLTENLQAQRDAAHGVSIDEEMVNLITHQQAYAAAARVITTADEMVQDLLNMV